MCADHLDSCDCDCRSDHEAMMGLGGNCYPTSYHPPHCLGVENGIILEGFAIPCGRGDTERGNFFKGTIYLVPVTFARYQSQLLAPWLL